MKKIISLLLGMVMMFSLSINAFAAENDTEEYLIVNGEKVVYLNEDWENPETGEYIRWGNERGVDKTFTFNIHYSLTSSKFTVNGSKVRIATTDIAVRSSNGKGSVQKGYKGHKYTIKLKGTNTKTLSLSLGKVQAGQMTGLKKGSKYSVVIINNDKLPSGYNLCGYGTIVS